MNISVIGVGAMGQSIVKHICAAGYSVMAYDTQPVQVEGAAKHGALSASSLQEAAEFGDIFIVIVATDEQSEQVTAGIIANGRAGSVITIVATNNPKTMQSLGALAKANGFGFVDAPVCYGRKGADEGTLVSLLGGSAADIERVTPILLSYSRAVHHVGNIGAGQLAKTCNNMLHWAACVANYEVLLLAKRYGIDGQAMREILLDCPGQNVTLERWDSTRFTWHEKDMDVALDIAQSGSVPIPMFGLVDQLVKQLGPEQVKDLLYGATASYLGTSISPLGSTEGGLNLADVDFEQGQA